MSVFQVAQTWVPHVETLAELWSELWAEWVPDVVIILVMSIVFVAVLIAMCYALLPLLYLIFLKAFGPNVPRSSYVDGSYRLTKDEFEAFQGQAVKRNMVQFFFGLFIVLSTMSMFWLTLRAGRVDVGRIVILTGVFNVAFSIGLVPTLNSLVSGFRIKWQCKYLANDVVTVYTERQSYSGRIITTGWLETTLSQLNERTGELLEISVDNVLVAKGPVVKVVGKAPDSGFRFLDSAIPRGQERWHGDAFEILRRERAQAAAITSNKSPEDQETAALSVMTEARARRRNTQNV